MEMFILLSLQIEQQQKFYRSTKHTTHNTEHHHPSINKPIQYPHLHTFNIFKYLTPNYILSMNN